MENNNQKKIIFDGGKDLNDIIMEILEKNGLKESLDDYIDKIDKNEKPLLDVLYKLTIDLATNDTTEQNFVLSIQQQMNISDKIAENILKEVKQKLLPMARTLSEEEIEEGYYTEPQLPQNINQPIGVAKILSQTQNKNVLPSQTAKKNVNILTKKTEPKQDEPPQEKKKVDAYREPIVD
ncbi:MAG: hypothetical protein Q8O66_03795 [bacterium]|nr:hypothetical protein [bacterium]